MIRVMHVLNTGSYSGAENVAITIINSMKHRVNATYVSLRGPIEKVLKENDIEYYPVTKLSIIELKKAIKSIKPDIIHAHDFTAGIMCVATNTSVPIINHLHNNPPWIKTNGVKSIVYMLACRKIKKIYTVSQSIENEYVYSNKICNKLSCIGNPIDTKKIVSLSRDSVMSLPEIKGNTILEQFIPEVVFVGRLTQQKNPELLVEICKTMVQKRPNIRFSIIGNGDMYQSIETKLATEISNGNIAMYGFISNPYPIMKQARALVMPSAWEGYGLVAVEALALGVPVVCSGAGGLIDIVNNNCGKICKNDKFQYIDELMLLVDDQNYYSKKSRAALERAQELDNLEDYSQQIYNDYICISEE